MSKPKDLLGIFNPIKEFLKREKVLCGLWVLVLSSAFFASLIQSNFGRIDVDTISIVEENGLKVTGILYRPIEASLDNKLPAVILCHGMNNDKNTESPLALELAKNGIIALSVDQLNHGDSDPGNNLLSGLLTETGENSEEPSPENTLGANAMYTYLKNAPFVDGTRMGMVGHSMGGSTVRELALLNPEHKAIAIQAGGPDNISIVTGMNNYLNLWPLYEELFINNLESRSEFIERGQNMIKYNLDLIGEEYLNNGYDQTYGNFSEGTAQRYALCKCTHPGTTWNAKSIRETVAWMLQALNEDISEQNAFDETSHQTYFIKELLLLASLIILLISIIPFFDMLIKLPQFEKLKSSPSKNIPLSNNQWWKTASINSAIGGITYIFLPGLGMVIGAIISFAFPVFRLLTGNGSVFWLLINGVICKKLFVKWKKTKQGIELSDEISSKGENAQLALSKISDSDLGLFHITEQESKLESMKKITKKEYIKTSFLIVLCIFIYLYLTVSLIQEYLFVELRFMWPILKEFTPIRLFLCIIYLIPVYYFFQINAGFFMFGQARLNEENKPWKTQLIWWIKILFMMEGGILVIFLIQYLPMFLFNGPPAFSISILTFLFGLYGIFLMQILPQFAITFFIMIALFRRTGKIYVSSMTGTLITTWIMAVSSMLV